MACNAPLTEVPINNCRVPPPTHPSPSIVVPSPTEFVLCTVDHVCLFPSTSMFPISICRRTHTHTHTHTHTNRVSPLLQLLPECCWACVRTTVSTRGPSRSACASAPGTSTAASSFAALPSATRPSTIGCWTRRRRRDSPSSKVHGFY